MPGRAKQEDHRERLKDLRRFLPDKIEALSLLGIA